MTCGKNVTWAIKTKLPSLINIECERNHKLKKKKPITWGILDWNDSISDLKMWCIIWKIYFGVERFCFRNKMLHIIFEFYFKIIDFFETLVYFKITKAIKYYKDVWRH